MKSVGLTELGGPTRASRLMELTMSVARQGEYTGAFN